MTAVVLGGAAGQWPLGWLSDRLDRRYVLAGICLGGVGVTVAIWMLAPVVPIVGLLLLGGAWGALAFPIYSIAVAQANDRASPDQYVMVSSGLLMMYGFGAISGPIIASGFMNLFGGAGLFAFTGLIHLVLAGFVSLRRRHSVPVTPDRHTEFSDALTATHTASSVFEEEMGAEEMERKAAGKTG
jgi:MFS family permease